MRIPGWVFIAVAALITLTGMWFLYDGWHTQQALRQRIGQCEKHGHTWLNKRITDQPGCYKITLIKPWKP